METVANEFDMKTDEANQPQNFNISLEPSKSDADGVDVQLSGRLTIEHAALIHDKVEIAMVQYTNVNLVLKEVKELDLAVIQLFFYLSLVAEEDENVLTISHQLPTDIEDLIQCTGLSLQTKD